MAFASTADGPHHHGRSTTMPKFASGTQKAAKAATQAKGSKEPQAYIFIGHDKVVIGDHKADPRTPQDWRKLFVVLARMAEEYDPTVKQNQFGLDLVYTKLVEYEAAAREALGDDYDAEVERHWADALAEDERRAEQRAKRAAEKRASGDDEEEDREEEPEEPVAPPTPPATPRRRS